MTDIFSKAARVIIWLGLETPNTGVAVRYFKKNQLERSC